MTSVLVAGLYGPLSDAFHDILLSAGLSRNVQPHQAVIDDH